MPPHVSAVFTELFEHIRFMKRQQWTITNYGALILAAIYAVRQQIAAVTSPGARSGTAIRRHSMTAAATIPDRSSRPRRGDDQC
jgi:hypothetical protein